MTIPKQRLFIRHLLTILGVSLTPLLAMGIVLYLSFEGVLKNRLVEVGFANLESIVRAVESEFSHWNTFTARLSIEKVSPPGSLETKYVFDPSNFRSIGDQIDTWRAIQRIKPDSTFLSTVVIVDEEFRQVISERILDIRGFTEYMDRYTRPPPGFYPRLRAAAQTPKRLSLQSTLSPDDGEQGDYSLFLVQALPFNSDHPLAAALYWIESNSMITVLRGYLAGQNAKLAVFDEEHKPLFVSDRGLLRLPFRSTLESAARAGDRSYEESVIDGERFGFFARQTPYMNLSFIYIAPTRHIWGTDQFAKGASALLFIFLCCSVLGAAVWTAGLTYRPIRQLADLALNNTSFNKSGDDVELIRRALEDGRSREQMDRARKLNSALEGISSGRWSPSKVASAAAEADIPTDFFGVRFVMAIISSEADTELGISEKAIEALTIKRSGAFQLIGYDLRRLPGIGILVLYTDRTSMENPNPVLQAIRASFHSVIPPETPFSLHYGKPYDSLADLHFSYAEAFAAFNASVGSSCVETLDHAEGELYGEYAAYPKSELLQFAASLELGQWRSLRRSFTRLSEWRRRPNTALFLRRCVYYELAGFVVESIRTAAVNADAPGIKSFLTSRSPTYATIIKACRDICEARGKQERSSDIRMRHRIEEYLIKEFRNPNLSLESISAHLGYSPAHVSRFFKAAMGCTFSERMRSMRFNEVKRKLVETDEPIKSIVAEIGNPDLANFIRTFRRAEGMTPGQYRELHRIKEA